jgi:hypothetical protein
MNRETILDALRRLGAHAQAANIRLEVSIYGGTAFLLAYDSREATRDVDAILRPKEEGQRLVELVARELDIPEDWLNSNVEQFVSPLGEAKRRLAEIEDATGLIVHVPTAGYLLAMKALACRRPIGAYQGDIEDLRFLIRKMEIQRVDQIQAIVDSFYPDDVIPVSDRALLETLIQSNDE